MNTNGKDNRIIRYNCDSLMDPTSDSNGNFEDYFIKVCES